MARGYGQRVPGVVRRKGIRSLQSLLAAGVEEHEACEEVARQANVSLKSAFNWLRRAYEDLSKEANASRADLLGVALRRRRLVMARAARAGDWKTYLLAADSESKLLGLNAPVLTEHHVLIDKVNGMSKAVVEVISDFFADEPAQRARFVAALRTRLNTQLAQRPDKLAIVVDGPEAIEAGNDEPVDASDPRPDAPTEDLAPTAAPAPDAPPSG